MKKGYFLLFFTICITFSVLIACDPEVKEDEEKETRDSIIGRWNTVTAKGAPYDTTWASPDTATIEFVDFEFSSNTTGKAIMESDLGTSSNAFDYAATVKSITISNWKYTTHPLIENGTYRLVVDTDTMKWFKDDVSTTDPYYQFEKVAVPN